MDFTTEPPDPIPVKLYLQFLIKMYYDGVEAVYLPENMIAAVAWP
jgi:hypothetical protein